MEQRKKIISILIKLLIGAGSFIIIYLRLKNDFNAEKLALLYAAAFSAKGALCFTLCLLLIPVNWGIESYRWQMITAPVQKVSYKTATKSVYSGVCLGNLAPGRATEFLARIIFFEPQNRSRVAVLHFINGMFQLSITILAGLLALLFHMSSLGKEQAWIGYAAGGLGVALLALLAISVYRLDPILKFVSKRLMKEPEVTDFHYSFSPSLFIRLFFLSALRYAVFFFQMSLLLYLFYQKPFDIYICSGIAMYFLITTIIPMISVLEAAIRAAVALVVFKDSGIGNTVLALSSVLIWLVNIIIPSIYGYTVLLKQNFNFKVFRSKA